VRLLLIARFIDALEQDYLAAFPEEMPLFQKGMEQEVQRLIEFWR
jgi:hypothetical protein